MELQELNHEYVYVYEYNEVSFLFFPYGLKSGGGKGGLIRCKLDGVGPIDNRPSTNKLHHFTHDT